MISGSSIFHFFLFLRLRVEKECPNAVASFLIFFSIFPGFMNFFSVHISESVEVTVLTLVPKVRQRIELSYRLPKFLSQRFFRRKQFENLHTVVFFWYCQYWCNTVSPVTNKTSADPISSLRCSTDGSPFGNLHHKIMIS